MKYRLNIKSNMKDFLSAVKKCKGNVYVDTAEGDHLNLKSQLCQYVFAFAFNHPNLLSQASITCEEKDADAYLAKYIIKEKDTKNSL